MPRANTPPRKISESQGGPGWYDEGVSRQVSNALRALAARLGERFSDRLGMVRLFGSHARGDAHEESDVDVLVVIEAPSWAERAAAADLATEVSFASGLCLSAVVLSREELEQRIRSDSSFIRSVLDEGHAP